MHSTLPLSALLLISPLLTQSLQIPRSYSNLAARQDDTWGTPYGNSDPWDDTDPDGTGSTTWLPDDYISGSGSSSGSSSDTTGTSDTAPSAVSLTTDEPNPTNYIPTGVSLPTGTDELFFGAETTAATGPGAIETDDVFTTDLSGAATTANFFAGASSSGAAASATGASASKPTTMSKASATKGTSAGAASSTGKPQPTAKVAGQPNAGEKTKAAGSMAALGVMVALAWFY
ncbi:MAG: hypothetical protein Q9167_006927 [Letrouitia subvulpina]